MRFDLNELRFSRGSRSRFFATRPAQPHRFRLRQRLLCFRGIGLHHLQSGFGTCLFHAWFFNARFFNALLFNAGRRSGLGHGVVVRLRLRLVRLRLALHLQPVFLQLLRVEGLLRALRLRRVLGPAFSAIGAIATISAATATTTSIAPSAARLFAFLPRRTVAVFRPRIRALLRGWPRLLLRTRMTLFGSPLTLRSIGLRPILPAVRTLCLRTLCLRLLSLLRNFRVRSIAVRPLRPGLLLLRGALVAPRLLVALCIAIAALLVRPATASVALVITRAIATSATSIASATSTASATLAAPMLVPVARFVVATFRALRPCATHARFVCRCGLLGRLVRLEPAEQASKESGARRFGGGSCGRGGRRGGRCCGRAGLRFRNDRRGLIGHDALYRRELAFFFRFRILSRRLGFLGLLDHFVA